MSFAVLPPSRVHRERRSLRPSSCRLTIVLTTGLSTLVPSLSSPRGAGAQLAGPETTTGRGKVHRLALVSQAPKAVAPHDDLLTLTEAARATFDVDGKGLTVAVLDTGLNVDHVDFSGEGRIPARRNFTHDDGAEPDKVTDTNGNGTNVGGIIVAHRQHTGVAPGANIVPLKILGAEGGGDFDVVERALRWVLKNHEKYRISAVLLALGDGGNYENDDKLSEQLKVLKQLIAELRRARVATVAPAGNDWFRFNEGKGRGAKQGMSFPAICPETISVGATFLRARNEPVSFADGASAQRTQPGQITPYSQRLHESVNNASRTDIFAPGGGILSSGIHGANSESAEIGTAQAAAFTAGTILLMQQYFKDRKGELPSVDDIERWLRTAEHRIVDGDNELDNVRHTGLQFHGISANSSLKVIRDELGR